MFENLKLMKNFEQKRRETIKNLPDKRHLLPDNVLEGTFFKRDNGPMYLVRGLALGMFLGGIFTFFLDPETGRQRRSRTRDRVLAIMRRGVDRVEDTGKYVTQEAHNLKQKATHRDPMEEENEASHETELVGAGTRRRSQNNSSGSRE